MYTTAYLSTADWNDTKFKNAKFDELLIWPPARTDEAKRKACIRKWRISCATKAA
jgi:peptide/nickel transport system substrate-binding protein